MKKITLFLIMGWLCGSVVCGGYDYEISGGYYGSTQLTGTQSLLMTGGWSPRIGAEDYSYIRVKGTDPVQGHIGGIKGLDVDGNSGLDLLGGEIQNISVWGNAQAVFEGGRIDYLASYQDVFDVIVGWDEDGEPVYNTHIEIKCRDYSYDAVTGRLTGTWGDESTFNIQLLDQAGYDPVIDNIMFTMLPEPVSIFLLAGGMIFIRKRY